MLLITQRPWYKITGNVFIWFSNKTRLATLLHACEPEPIAIEQSASFNAITSFTPSPVMATVLFLLFKANTSSFFCSGVTRPKIEYESTTISTSFIVDISILFDVKPAFLANASTVLGSSPEIIFISTPCFLKKFKVSLASGLNSSRRQI